MSRRANLVALLLAMCLPALAWGHGAPAQQKSQDNAKKPETQAEVADAQAKAANADPAYTIGAEDVLSINVWKEADVSRTVPVRPDGKISLPLLNDVQAAGLTPQQLAASIREGLKKYMSDPEVTVIVSAVNSRKVYIIGEVTRPGVIPLLSGMTVLQALASAGTFTQFANLKGIYVLRTENGKQVKHPFNYKAVVKGQNAEQNLELKPGDTIVVP
ncbi:MAG TPA: polysaccharide biosynthesis/export family protein [Candidatus Acidoferrales bacterium]|nr:polysaccharide biosynthesis/export family protein [Candidatus Acidoferrales bacterium]